MLVQPYLNFDGRAEEAIEFYRKAVGAELLMLMRFRECPDAQPGSITPGAENKIMHSCLRIGDSQVMLSDGYCQGKTSFQGISLSLTVANEAEAKSKFDALAAGGEVRLPLTKTFFSPSFGMVADRFGVSWMVIVPGEAATKAGARK